MRKFTAVLAAGALALSVPAAEPRGRRTAAARLEVPDG
jgi:hypothetical protein